MMTTTVTSSIKVKAALLALGGHGRRSPTEPVQGVVSPGSNRQS